MDYVLYEDPILTDFFSAFHKSFNDAINYIQTYGVSYKNENAEGATFLHVAALFGNLQLMQYLIVNGADVNAVDNKGRTPLYECVFTCEKPELAFRLLMSNGADLSIIPKVPWHPKETILDIAKKWNKHEIVNLIEKTKEERTCGSCSNVCGTIQKKKPKMNIENKVTLERNQVQLDDCIVCYDARTEIYTLVPCGHAKTCENCCKNVVNSQNSTCPFCRSIVTSYIKIYH